MIKEKKIDEIEIEDFKSRIKKEGIAGFENHTNEEIATIINESNKFISNIEKELKKEDESDLCHKAFLDAKNYTVEKYECELIKIIESGVFVGYETFDTHFNLSSCSNCFFYVPPLSGIRAGQRACDVQARRDPLGHGERGAGSGGG